MLGKIINVIVALLVVLLFLGMMGVSVIGTGWDTVEELPQTPEDQSNIERIGVSVFTKYVVPFEIMAIVLLSALIGAFYMGRGADSK
ncbi:F420H2 dehydrogenase subunit FpoJ [Methanohalobium sp.]|uniref:F420H2 dehydrogenase subunit FpoJ n=1 Tax=Methanohalobium sp. TaxID=2837493 RepID=UPI0025F9A89E|nr:F420H2 dehydrogenase subunit FpoJ [Methanohalobium sp.]